MGNIAVHSCHIGGVMRESMSLFCVNVTAGSSSISPLSFLSLYMCLVSLFFLLMYLCLYLSLSFSLCLSVCPYLSLGHFSLLFHSMMYAHLPSMTLAHSYWLYSVLSCPSNGCVHIRCVF